MGPNILVEIYIGRIFLVESGGNFRNTYINASDGWKIFQFVEILFIFL